MSNIRLQPNYLTIANFTAAHKLKNASNMLEVSTIINDAWIDFFDIRHFGMLRIYVTEVGCSEFFDEIKRVRMQDAQAAKASFYQHMMYFIPERMNTSNMYNDMLHKYVDVQNYVDDNPGECETDLHMSNLL